MKLTITKDNGESVLELQTDDTSIKNITKILEKSLNTLEKAHPQESTDFVKEKIKLKRDFGWHFAYRIEEISHNESIRKEIFKSPRMKIFAVLDPEKDLHLQEAQAYTNSRAVDIRDKVFAIALEKTTTYFLKNKSVDVLPKYLVITHP